MKPHQSIEAATSRIVLKFDDENFLFMKRQPEDTGEGLAGPPDPNARLFSKLLHMNEPTWMQ